MSGTSLAVMRLDSYEAFQTWLANDLEARDELDALIGDELGMEVESLDRLEAFLLERFSSPDEALGASVREILDQAARHIGFVMVLNVDGASWGIDVDNPASAYYRLPIVRLSDGSEECPISMATACLDRRTGTYLRTIVEGYEEDYNTDSSG